MDAMLAVTVILASLSQSLAQTTTCQSVYHGTCVSLFGTCASGSSYSYSHCGFLEMCCLQPASFSHPSGGTSSGGTSSGGTSSGSGSSSGSTSTSTSSGSCGVSLAEGSHRIVGGSTANSDEYPWQVSLRYGGHHMCGGTLIDNQWVLTAAHCFKDTYLNYWTVALGVHDRGHIYTNQIHQAARVIVHSSYDSVHNLNDIALVKLDRAIDVNGRSIRAACLPGKIESFDNTVCTVTGWGSTFSGGSGTRYLHEVDVPIMTNSLCRYYLGNTIHDSNICAGLRNGGKDACQGDSGGPLTCKKNGRWELAGIVSWGYGCGQRNAPGVYTRVSSYIDWINTQKASH